MEFITDSSCAVRNKLTFRNFYDHNFLVKLRAWSLLLRTVYSFK